MKTLFAIALCLFAVTAHSAPPRVWSGCVSRIVVHPEYGTDKVQICGDFLIQDGAIVKLVKAR